MWVYQRMFDLHYTANLLESDPGSKPEQAARQVKKFRDELAALQSEIDAMSKAHPEIAAHQDRSVPGSADGSKPPNPPARRCPWICSGRRRAVPAATARRGSGSTRQRHSPGSGDAGVWFNDAEPDLTFFDAKPVCR
jgi:hypothetical protein